MPPDSAAGIEERRCRETGVKRKAFVFRLCFYMIQKNSDTVKLVITEKPSVAQSVANAIGANEKKDGYMEGNGYFVSWCIGHLVELAAPDVYIGSVEKMEL